MRIIAATDDFRKIAESVCVYAEDLTTVDGRNGWWHLSPQSFIDHTELVSLTQSYNRVKVRYQTPIKTQAYSIERRSLILPNMP